MMRIQAPRMLADVLLSAVPQLSDRLLEHRIRQAWTSLVGADVARRTRPRELANGCLHVAVDNSPWLHELTLRAPDLTARLSAREPAIRSLRFVLGTVETAPSPSPERGKPPRLPLTAEDRRDIDAAAAAISDPALAEAARRLLTAACRDATRARGTAR